MFNCLRYLMLDLKKGVETLTEALLNWMPRFLANSFLAFKNRVKGMQTTGYNGAHTVDYLFQLGATLLLTSVVTYYKMRGLILPNACRTKVNR